MADRERAIAKKMNPDARGLDRMLEETGRTIEGTSRRSYKAGTMKPPRGGVRKPASLNGFTNQDNTKLRKILKTRKAAGKQGEVTVRESVPGSGQWEYVYPNGRTKPTPSSKSRLV